MAHEIGHAASLQHSPCGTPGDVNYPAYEPYDPLNTPSASLGEYGLNINNGVIHQPAEKDYMSYCSQNWISLYHQSRLTNNNKFNPLMLHLSEIRIPGLVDPYLWPWEYIPDPPWWEINPGDLRMKAQKVISIIGIYNEQRQVEIQSIMRITALPVVRDSVETNFVANLLGNRGEILSRAPVMRLKSHGHGCCCHDMENSKDYEGPFVFQALIPDIGPGSALSIVKKGNDDERPDKEVWNRQAPESQPQITKFDVRVDGDKGIAEWNLELSTDRKPEFSLQFSKDEGRSWNSLAVGIQDYGYEFSINDIPTGDIIFRLLAHDGFFTSAVESKPVVIPRHVPTISILHPQESSILVAGMPMRLWATVNTSTTPETEIRNHIWVIDGEETAQGIDTWITAPKKGIHKCTFIVQYDNTQSEWTISFNTIDSRGRDDSTQRSS
jgi:hypothetical protein